MTAGVWAWFGVELYRLTPRFAELLAALNFDLEKLSTHFAADVREIAVLWFVFANLDALVQNKMTVTWALTHTGVSVAGWLVGAYLEVKPPKRNL
jgi:hypothetical protein